MGETPYNPEMCCHCGSRAYSTVLSGPIVPIIKCTGCGLMRQGWITRTENNAFVDYAGGTERFRRQKAEKEAAHTVDFLKISDRLEDYVPR